MCDKFYENGLNFECQRCSFCCGHSPGFVYLSERDFLAFIETLQELKPDIVISWGTTTLSRIREDNEYVSKQDKKDCYDKTKGYYCRMNIPKIEHTIFLFNCYHPSSPDWYSCFDDAAKYMKEL